MEGHRRRGQDPRSRPSQLIQPPSRSSRGPVRWRGLVVSAASGARDEGTGAGPVRGGWRWLMARCCPRFAPATGCLSIQPPSAGRDAERWSCSMSLAPTCSRSSGSSDDPATGFGSATPGSSSARTRPGCWATRRRMRSRRPVTGPPSTRVATAPSPSRSWWDEPGCGTGRCVTPGVFRDLPGPAKHGPDGPDGSAPQTSAIGNAPAPGPPET